MKNQDLVINSIGWHYGHTSLYDCHITDETFNCKGKAKPHTLYPMKVLMQEQSHTNEYFSALAGLSHIHEESFLVKEQG